MKRLIAALWLIFLAAAPAQAAKVQEVKTPGGFTAWLVEEHAVPLVTVRLAFKESGQAHDPKGKEGRARFTAALITEGAGDMDARTFQEALESIAASLATDTDEDEFFMTLETLSEHKEEAFSLMGMALTKPRLDGDAAKRVRSQALSLLERREQAPHYRLRRAWQKHAYGDHPYGRSEFGTREGLSGLSPRDARNFIGRYLSKENIVIAVVGDITPQELSRLLDDNLSQLAERYDPDSEVPEFALTGKSEPVAVAFDIPQTMVAFGSPGLKRRDPDYFIAYVMNHILGGGSTLSDRLGREIRQKRGLAYSVSSNLEPKTHAAAWAGYFATRTEQAGEAREVLIETLKDFVKNGPSQQELDDAKTFLTGSFVLNLDSNASIAGFLISMQISDLGRDYFEKRNAMVEAVTREQVQAMAGRLIDPDKLLVVTLGK